LDERLESRRQRLPRTHKGIERMTEIERKRHLLERLKQLKQDAKKAPVFNLKPILEEMAQTQIELFSLLIE
jgi:hypothetical protein